MKRKLTALAKVLTNVFAILFGIIWVAGIIMKENISQVTGVLGGELQKMVTDPSDEEKLKENPFAFEYFASDFTSIDDPKANGIAAVKQYGRDMIEKVVGEGVTLLKNDNEALPLSKGDKVNLYSASSVNLVYAGTGSSGTNTSESINLKQALEDEDVGLSVNADLWNWYYANRNNYGRGSAGGSVGTTFAINEASWSNIAASSGKDQAADAAIFVLARNGGEGADLTLRGGTGDMTNGNYLELSPNEKDVLTNLKALKNSGKIGKIIILMNTANPVQCDFVDDARYGIDAMLWCGDLGSTGANAVADILVGNLNPSGKLSDTFWTKHYYNPVYANWGAYNYTGSVSSGNSNTYVAYQEGIYNGYLYTETRYEDYVLEQGNAGEFLYDEIVSYPFGYGVSYTQFSYSDFKVTAPSRGSDDYTVSVTVKNTGSVAGKEVAQIYLQKPYTEYDIENGIEKASVELVGFAKTKLLDGGDSETLTISVPKRLFASYDANGEMTYIVDEGDYYFATGNGAHEAINNILALKGKSTSNGMTADGTESLAARVEINKFDGTTYSTSTIAVERGIVKETTKITNQFDNADLNRYEGKGNNEITYISRNDWDGTVKLGLSDTHASLNNQVKITATDGMKEDVKDPTSKIERDDSVEYPTYGSTDTSYTLADLRAYSDGDDDVTNDKPIEYDHEMWDALLDQLTFEETAALLGNGFRLTAAIESIGKPLTIDHNGATGPTLNYVAAPDVNTYTAGANRGLAQRLDADGKNESSPLYPCNGLVASTFNAELMEEYGKAWGENCLWAGYNGLYGPGLNIHRGAYGGRAFEYYSEDGFLTGKTAAYMTKGMAKKGVYVYLKHCVLNDQEKNREGICTWANEQSIREVYLKGFQIAIEEGGAQCVMTGFNRLGVVWTGHQGFCNTVLRKEFGMTGLAVSDWWQSYMTLPAAVLNGNDVPDADKTSLNAFAPYGPDRGGYGELAWEMRESAHRILYTVVQSNAMNGMTSSTKIIQLTPYWVPVTTAVQIVSGILFGVSAIFLIVMLFGDKLLKKKH